MTLLIIVVAIGFVGCWYLLWRIEGYAHHCLLKLIDLDRTADKIEEYAGQISVNTDG